MKNRKHQNLLIIGFLLIGIPTLIMLFTNTNGEFIHIIDFFKGVGVALLLGSVFIYKKTNQTTVCLDTARNN